MTQGQVKIITWDQIKKSPPKELKLSPISQIPHKSRAYRTILDLAFSLLTKMGKRVPSVNSTTIPTAPEAALTQMGSVLPRLIIAMAQSPDDATIYFSKFDIQDGFWRMINELGKEYNFAFVMPTTKEEPIQIVVPTSLQMGWVESPGFFSGASETARDVAEEYAEAPLGKLPEHHLEEGTLPTANELKALEEGLMQELKYLIEVYMDDFITAAQAQSLEQLQHLSRAVLHAIHDVFPENVHSEGDQPVSKKKIDKGEAKWDTLKEVLGWLFDGRNKSIQLPEEKVEKILAVIKKMLRSKAGTPFNEFRKLMGKLQHAAIGIPAGKGLMTPLNHQLAKQHSTVWFRKGTQERQALQLWKELITEAGREPTRAKELTPGEPNYVGLMDASRGGTGGVWLSGTTKISALVWRHEWPPEIQEALDQGRITINDLEMAGKLLGWLVLEGTGVDLKHKHVALLNDNSSAVSWILRWAAKSKGPAGQLLAALALRQRQNRASPLAPEHVAGELNDMADVASRSFGYKEEWHCRSTDDLLTLFNKKFPLPAQSSWQSFQLSSKVVTKVICALQMKQFDLQEWRKLSKTGTNISRPGASSCNLGELTHFWESKRPRSMRECGSSQPSEQWSGRESWATATQSKLARSARRSAPLRRPSRWNEAKLPSTTRAENTTCRSG